MYAPPGTTIPPRSPSATAIPPRSLLMKILVRKWVYRHHPRAWAALCFAVSCYLVVMGSILCAYGFWFGALVLAAAALQTRVGFHLQHYARS